MQQSNDADERAGKDQTNNHDFKRLRKESENRVCRLVICVVMGSQKNDCIALKPSPFQIFVPVYTLANNDNRSLLDGTAIIFQTSFARPFFVCLSEDDRSSNTVK